MDLKFSHQKQLKFNVISRPPFVMPTLRKIELPLSLPFPLLLILSFKPKFHSIKFIQIFAHKKLICQGKEPF